MADQLVKSTTMSCHATPQGMLDVLAYHTRVRGLPMLFVPTTKTAMLARPATMHGVSSQSESMV